MPHWYDLLSGIRAGLPQQGVPRRPMAQLLDRWRAVGEPLWSGLHGQLRLLRNVSHEAGEGALEELRDALLVTLLGRS
ncbi:hypothetical protein ABZ434_23305 [Streptomyces sp. NPDC005761]|uniref:hypothetical protein n=1 Tax=unclassified Streptomyces TaxID=2593676 RepID=UPI003411E4E2